MRQMIEMLVKSARNKGASEEDVIPLIWAAYSIGWQEGYDEGVADENDLCAQDVERLGKEWESGGKDSLSAFMACIYIIRKRCW